MGRCYLYFFACLVSRWPNTRFFWLKYLFSEFFIGDPDRANRKNTLHKIHRIWVKYWQLSQLTSVRCTVLHCVLSIECWVFCDIYYVLSFVWCLMCIVYFVLYIVYCVVKFLLGSVNRKLCKGIMFCVVLFVLIVMCVMYCVLCIDMYYYVSILCICIVWCELCWIIVSFILCMVYCVLCFLFGEPCFDYCISYIVDWCLLICIVWYLLWIVLVYYVFGTVYCV